MNPARFRWFRTKLRRLIRRGKQEAELNSELKFHFDQLVTEFEAEGMSKYQATAAAHREFGTTDSYREEMRDSWTPPQLADFWRSVTSAIRSLARSPGFTILSIITLALGIGANTAMYSVANEVILRPLPYPDSHLVDRIYRSTAQDSEGSVAAADFLTLQNESDPYGMVASYAYADATVHEPGEPAEMAPAMRVSTGFFETFGILPNRGRSFTPAEDNLGNDHVVIISQRYWENRFDHDPAIIGRVIRVNGESHEVVGVMPEQFSDWRFMGWIDIYRPLALTTSEIEDQSNLLLNLIGRRNVDLNEADTAGFLSQFGEHLTRNHPTANAGATWRAVPIEVVKVGDGKISLGMLIGLSGFVLLIACSNLANLLLARTMARAREFALRAALGASRMQLLRPLMLESLLLALAGGALAILVAEWGTSWMSLQTTDNQGSQVIFPTDLSVFVWALLASIAAALIFGIAPALFASRLDLNQTLKSGGRGTSGGKGHQRLRNLLIIGQFALAMVLLSGAALFLRGLDDLNNRRQGWESDDLVVGTFLLPKGGYADANEITQFQRELLSRLEALPAVETASLSHSLPFFGLDNPRKLVVEGREPPEPGKEPAAVINGVSPSYFETVGTRLHAGRTFADKDRAESGNVFIINQSMARTLFGDTEAVGRRIAFLDGDQPDWGEIVGVVDDIKSISSDTNPVTFQLYRPMEQEPLPYNEFALRMRDRITASTLDDVRNLIMELDPALPIRNLKDANSRIDRANYQTGVMGSMLTSFAVLGLGLASLGIYGVIARIMAQRTTEFGIRMALGAQVKDITRLVLGAGVKLSMLGAGLGLIGALGLSRLIAMNFPGMQMESAPVLVGATLLLMAVALLASYLPARRAANISPVEALRAE